MSFHFTLVYAALIHYWHKLLITKKKREVFDLSSTLRTLYKDTCVIKVTCDFLRHKVKTVASPRHSDSFTMNKMRCLHITTKNVCKKFWE